MWGGEDPIPSKCALGSSVSSAAKSVLPSCNVGSTHSSPPPHGPPSPPPTAHPSGPLALSRTWPPPRKLSLRSLSRFLWAALRDRSARAVGLPRPGAAPPSDLVPLQWAFSHCPSLCPRLPPSGCLSAPPFQPHKVWCPLHAGSWLLLFTGCQGLLTTFAPKIACGWGGSASPWREACKHLKRSVFPEEAGPVRHPLPLGTSAGDAESLQPRAPDASLARCPWSPQLDVVLPPLPVLCVPHTSSNVTGSLDSRERPSAALTTFGSVCLCIYSSSAQCPPCAPSPQPLPLQQFQPPLTTSKPQQIPFKHSDPDFLVDVSHRFWEEMKGCCTLEGS
ncbi:leucine-rich repeat-containing protein 61 isoform X2 [Mustela putorius furo]|uniref:Leucine-rich repeat-containing protein 61 isoform X2 n=1 Tax=Mustela putorius furo TaxID=9669 RepID=A0A8U0SHJ8_MUSPF|nr:leucine-rich repeat-containing protein 61 isoform X2 [Mustela putorius furo]